MKNNQTNNETYEQGNQQKNESCSAHVCSHKMAFMLNNWVRKLIQKPNRIVGEYISEGDTVVDLGCGPGFFSIEMAKITGPKGKVFAVDLQEEMLAYTKKKAAKKKVSNRLHYHKCETDRVGLEMGEDEKADFMLAYYMIHETPDPAAFLQEVKSLLKDGGKFLVVEPKMHVSQQLYEEMIEQAKEAGFKVLDHPSKKGGRSVLLGLNA